MLGVRLAALPMYDFVELRPQTDAFWQAVARHLRGRGMDDVPPALERGLAPEALWTHPRLLLAQTCGLPLVTFLDRRVRLVATPFYALEGAAGGDYRSWLVVAEASGIADIAELEGRTAAVNAPHSQSGANALAALTAPLARGRPFFADLLVTGGHLASIEAVRQGRAQAAAIDCVTWALVKAVRPEMLCGLEVIAASEPVPALPFITSAASDTMTVARLAGALAAVSGDVAAARAWPDLGLVGVTTGADYGRIRAMYRTSLEAGCARLATLMRESAPFA